MWEHIWPTQISEGELELVVEKNKDFLFLNKKGFRLFCAACGILVLQPGIKPVPFLLRAWTAKEVLKKAILKF